MLVTTRLDLGLLGSELTTAGVPHNALGLSAPDPSPSNPVELFTYDAQGTPVELPPEAGPVVAAHTAPPLAWEYAGRTEHSAVLQTTDDTPTAILRVPLEIRRQYAATVTFLGVEPATFATKLTDMRYAWKRVTAGATLVGEFPLADIPDQGAASWDVRVSAAGADVVVEVIGGRTQTVDWLVRATVETFAPEGL